MHNSKTNENLLSNTTVDCKDNTYYIDDLIQVYDEKFILKRAILSPINTRACPHLALHQINIQAIQIIDL